MTFTQIMDHLANGLLDASLKSAVVLLAAAVIALCLRKRSAALRHATWVMALASWCAPCVAEMPNVKSAASAYASDQRLVVLSLNLDQTEANAQTFLKKNGSIGTEAFLPGMWDNPTVQAFGVRSIPSIWLIGPDGKVIAKGLRGEQIKATLANAVR